MAGQRLKAPVGYFLSKEFGVNISGRWMMWLSALGSMLSVYGADFAQEKQAVLALGELTQAPVMMDAAGVEADGNVRAIYYDALNYQGRPTKVFAWLGLPEHAAGEVPGVVLVHGGGGTAFKEWVQRWNDKGFAAISIAVEGQTDQRNQANAGTDNPKGWQPHAWPGPKRVGIYGDSLEPLKDQWMYHAVADTILANSLLRSLPGVDAEKVGLMGISWGGVITSTVIGIDDRFAFAIPTYGCGHLFDAENQYGAALGQNELYRQVWDPMVRIDRAQMPTLWLSWPSDVHFPLDKQAACYRNMPGPAAVTLIPGMKHGHGAGWRPPDSYAFAQSVVEEGKPWLLQEDVTVKGQQVEVVFHASKPLDRAVLISTLDHGVTGSRSWTESEISLKALDGQRWRASATLPAQTTGWLVNVKSGALTGSSFYQEAE